MFMLIFVSVTSSQTKMMTVKHNTTSTTTLNTGKWRNSLGGQCITSETLPPNLILKAELKESRFRS